MKDVAEIAGVSVSTVSRVISGKFAVEEGTASRVRSAILQLDYRPNLLAWGLRSRSGKFIGLVIPGIHEPFATMIGLLEEYVTRGGYSLLFGNTESGPEKENIFIDDLISRHVDGIVFSGVSEKSLALPKLAGTDIPIVLFDRVFNARDNVVTVALNNEAAGRLAARYLVGLGHRRVATITGPPDLNLCKDRLHGFKDEVSRLGAALDERDIEVGDFSFDAGLKASQALFARTSAVTAVWAQNDLMAIGLMRGLASLGKRVPRDVSIVGADDIPFARMTVPSLSTVRQPFEAMCRQAVSSLLGYDDLSRSANRHFAFDPELVRRESAQSP